MSVESARKWVIVSSLIITGALFVFFLVAPTLGFPLEYSQAIRLLQIALPVFFGYLGSASRFIFKTGPTAIVNEAEIKNSLFGLLVKGPVIVFIVANAAAFFSFAYSNRAAAEPGTGMDVDTLATIITVALSLLAVTTNAAVSFLFDAGDKPATST